MVTRVCVVALIIGFIVGADTLSDNTAQESKKLQGTWMVQSATEDGKEKIGEKGHEFVFSAKNLTIRGAGKQEKFAYKLDTVRKPKTMEFVAEEKKPNSSPGHVAYELDGDTLRLCITPPDRRATEITDKGQVLLTLKRKKSSAP